MLRMRILVVWILRVISLLILLLHLLMRFHWLSQHPKMAQLTLLSGLQPTEQKAISLTAVKADGVLRLQQAILSLSMPLALKLK